ncbi:MAG: glycosyltransferase family 39 protein, partial [Fimbriimonadales bacterium]
MNSSKRPPVRTKPHHRLIEWTPSLKRHLLAMGILFGFALLLRLWGIGWGLPNADHYFSYHPDEWIILIASYFVVNPYAGEWLPGFYNYGSLPLYLWSGWLHWLTAFGVIPSLPESPTGLEVAQLRASLHAWARVWVAILGAGTAVVVAQTLRQVANERAGWLAGAVMAVAPAFVVHSRFQTVDVPTTFFVALALYQSVALWRSERPWRTLVWGALWSGCAAGCKYNAGLVAIAPMVGWWLRSGASAGWATRLKGVALALSVSVGVFLLVCPGAWADSERFWRDFSYEVRHVQQGHGEIFTDTGLGWLYHLAPNLTTGFTVLGLIGSVLGWGLSGWRIRALWGVLAFTFAYYLLIGGAEVRFLRYTLPMYPMLALGVGLLGSAEPKSRLAALPTVLSIGVVLFQLSVALSYTACMVRPDARDQALSWIRQHLPAGASVGFATVPWFYTPPLYPETGELRWQDRLQKLQEAESPFRLVSLAPPEWSSEALRANRPDYLVLSEFEWRDVERIQRADYRQFRAQMEQAYERVAQ